MIKKLKGFSDKWEFESEKYWFLIQIFNNFASKNNFKFLINPIIEDERVFLKTLGVTSDIVQKEFFYIQNKKEVEKYVLRPELTSGIIRAILEKKEFLNKKTLNIYTFGNCFRYEKPQKGRYREFFQWSFEQVFTDEINYLKIFSFLNLIINFFNLENDLILKINFISLNQLNNIRVFFKEKFKNFKLCKLCEKRKIINNVYRILDCKECKEKISKKIDLYSFLNQTEKDKFEKIKKEIKTILPNLNIKYDFSLTRGLDYYDGIVFELLFISDNNWAQNTILAGGEYKLSSFDSKFNEKDKGIGFAIGIERFLILLNEKKYFEKNNFFKKEKISIFIKEENFKYDALKLSNELILNNYFNINNLKPTPFLKCLQKNIEKKNKWLIYFGDEFKFNNKILIRKITSNNKKKIQFIVSVSEIFDILGNN